MASIKMIPEEKAGGRMPPEWWREYRRRRQEHLREYNRQRRQTPKLKAQRRASEQRRLAKKRPPPCPDPLPPLYPSPQVGKYLSFWEDELRLDLARHTLGLDMSFHTAHTPGEMIERIDGDVMALSNFFSQFIIQVFGNLLLVVGILLVLVGTDWRISLALTIFVALTLFILLRLANISVGSWEEERQASAELFGFLEERMSGTEDIRSNNARAYVLDRFYRLTRTLMRARDFAGILLLALFFSSITWDEHLVWMIPAGYVVVWAAARLQGELSRTGYIRLALYVVLTMVLNYEVVGSARWEALKSYHHLGLAMLILYGLLLGSRGGWSHLSPSLEKMHSGPPHAVSKT